MVSAATAATTAAEATSAPVTYTRRCSTIAGRGTGTGTGTDTGTGTEPAALVVTTLLTSANAAQK